MPEKPSLEKIRTSRSLTPGHVLGFPLASPSDMLMRSMTDKRILAEVKRDKILQLRAQGRSVILYEDDPHVVKVVNEATGEQTAVLCTWSVKEVEMIRTGQA